MAQQLHRIEVPVSSDDREPVIALLWALGARGVWERPDRLVAWLSDPAAVDDDRLTHAARGPITVRPEPEQDWQATWKATIAPVRAGRTVVVPTWLADRHRAEAEELTLVLDPGQAFGTGHHATTALCLELLDELDLAGQLQGRTLADVGCGSGILAIAAAARGAAVEAIDLDPDAVAVARTNAAANGVAVTATVGAVEDLTLTTDIVVANLISDVVRDNAAALVTAASQRLLVSGITEERAEEVLDALVAHGAEVVEVRRRGGWVAASLVPTARGGPAAPPPAAGDRHHRAGRPAAGRAHGLLLTVALLALALLGGACTEPEGLDPTEPAPDEEPAAIAPTPEQEGLLAEVAAMEDLLERIDLELAAATEADTLDGLRAAVGRAERLLVVDVEAATPALFPSQELERNQLPAAPDALTDTLTEARNVGGTLGRSVVEKLRDPIAGDLGSWELDAPGVIASAQATTAGASDEAAASEQVLLLDGEGPRAIAWLALAAGTDDLTLARAAVRRAGEHVEVMRIALVLATEPPAPGREPADPGVDPPTEELGPGIDPDELEDAAGRRDAP